MKDASVGLDDQTRAALLALVEVGHAAQPSKLGRRLGTGWEAIAAALERLEVLGLAWRSGSRFYRPTTAGVELAGEIEGGGEK